MKNTNDHCYGAEEVTGIQCFSRWTEEGLESWGEEPVVVL